jgi:hypothetical protein
MTIVILVLMAGLIGLFVFLFFCSMFWARDFKAKHAAESAALAAAHSISRIVVEDPFWGYVSLSDHPACGKDTLAADKEALPVVGINSAIAACRTETLLAEALGSDDLKEVALADCKRTVAAADHLQECISKSLKPGLRTPYSDMNGEKVKPYDLARKMFEENMPECKGDAARLTHFDLKLGWLEDGSTTVHATAERSGAVPDKENEFYKAFVNQPAAGKSFFFAGNSDQARTVDPARFRKPDGKRVCSALQLNAQLEYSSDSQGKGKLYDVNVDAAALPGAAPDKSASGSLVLYFPQGTVRQWATLRKMLTDRTLQSVNMSTAIATGGDYPTDSAAHLASGPSQTTAHALARAIADWIRTNRGRTSVDAILKAFDEPFDPTNEAQRSELAVLYEFDKNGNCVLHRMNYCGLANNVSDKQSFASGQDITASDAGSVSLGIRDEVTNNSIADGGKHAGQPLLNALPVNYTSASSAENEFDKSDRSNYRQSYLKGGLAVCIEVTFRGSNVASAPKKVPSPLQMPQPRLTPRIKGLPKHMPDFQHLPPGLAGIPGKPVVIPNLPPIPILPSLPAPLTQSGGR